MASNIDLPSRSSEESSSSLRVLPPDSWDSHMHIFKPDSLDLETARYRPIPSTLPLALDFESSVGLRNIVLVQPSCYGYDNSYLLQALAKLGHKHARAVVAFDLATTPFATLEYWHRLGVRGVRINLKSVDATVSRPAFEDLLRAYADVIRPFGWLLQLYMPMELVEWLEDFAADLDVKICLDHFGCPDLSSESSQSRNPYDVAGFRSVVNLLRQGRMYVKFSGAYRVSNDPALRDLEPLALELLRIAGRTQLVFATDWPHTRFNGLDIKPFVQQCVEWCGHDNEQLFRLFQGNAEDLWDTSNPAGANL